MTRKQRKMASVAGVVGGAMLCAALVSRHEPPPRGSDVPSTSPASAAQPRGASGPGGDAVLADDAAPSVRPFSVAAGTVLHYGIESHWDIQLDVPTAHDADDGGATGARQDRRVAERIAVDLQGAVDIAVLEAPGDAYVLRVQLHPTSIRGLEDGKGRAVEHRMLERPMLVRFSPEGRVLGYAFPEETPHRAKKLLIQLFGLSHQFPARDSARPWRVRGLPDEMGLFTGELGWIGQTLSDRYGDGGTIRREVVGYDDLAGVRIRRSDSRASFRDGWIEQVTAFEDRDVEMLGLRTQSRVRVGMRLVGRSATTSADPGDLAGVEWALSFRAPVETANEEDVLEGAPDESVRLQQVLQSLAGVVERGELDGREAFDCWLDLARLAAAFPDTVLPRLTEALHGDAFDPDAKRWIATALAKAGADGSSAAVEALASLALDPSTPEQLRLAALMASHHLGENSAGIVEAAGILLGDGGGGSMSDVENAAAHLVGSLAGQDLPEAAADLVAASLEEVRERSFATGEPEVYFEALSNSERPELIAEALEYLDSPDERTRRAAVEALAGLAGDPRAADALLLAASTDGAVEVRLAALRAMSELTADARIPEALGRVVFGESGAELQTEAVLALARLALAGSAPAEAELGAARNSAVPEVRDLATSLLGDLEASRSQELASVS